MGNPSAPIPERLLPGAALQGLLTLFKVSESPLHPDRFYALAVDRMDAKFSHL